MKKMNLTNIGKLIVVGIIIWKFYPYIVQGIKKIKNWIDKKNNKSGSYYKKRRWD